MVRPARRRSGWSLAAWAALVIAVVIVGKWQQRSEAVPEARPARVEQVAPPSVPGPREAAPPDVAAADASALEELVPDAVEREQLAATIALIEQGGPFPYDKDGSVFQNRERALPARPRGYYREYTVPTPGASNRGARRVVRGESGETWYTRDHYRTFMRIDP